MATKRPKGRTLNFGWLGNNEYLAYSIGVTDTLLKLGIDFDCDDTSPPNNLEQVKYKVIGVQMPGKLGPVPKPKRKAAAR